MRRLLRLAAIVAIALTLLCTVVIGLASPTTGPIEKAVLCGVGLGLLVLARRLLRGRGPVAPAAEG
jgi:peptidoglycan/LPS O-acetylase OafA/YrhL